MTEPPYEGACSECRQFDGYHKMDCTQRKVTNASAEVAKLRNELTLAKACADAAGSQMLDLQQDCIASVKLLTELRDAAAAVAALIPTPDAWPARWDEDKLRQRAQRLREVIGRVP